ncbi:hypothetical protein D3C77_389240 [compost metagenome]
MARIDLQRADRLGKLRQIQALLFQGHLAGQQVLAAGDALGMQRGAGRAGDQQGLAVEADGRLLDRAALAVELQRLLAERIDDPRRNGLLVVRVGDLVLVLDDQRLTVAQTEHQAAGAGGVLADRDDAAVSR